MPSPLFLTSVSFFCPLGLVTMALTLPWALGDTDLASTVNSLGQSRNTPVQRSKPVRAVYTYLTIISSQNSFKCKKVKNSIMCSVRTEQSIVNVNTKVMVI